jgi:hypothetical protein
MLKWEPSIRLVKTIYLLKNNGGHVKKFKFYTTVLLAVTLSTSHAITKKVSCDYYNSDVTKKLGSLTFTTDLDKGIIKFEDSNYKEASNLDRMVKNIDATDYPSSKLIAIKDTFDFKNENVSDGTYNIQFSDKPTPQEYYVTHNIEINNSDNTSLKKIVLSLYKNDRQYIFIIKPQYVIPYAAAKYTNSIDKQFFIEENLIDNTTTNRSSVKGYPIKYPISECRLLCYSPRLNNLNLPACSKL